MCIVNDEKKMRSRRNRKCNSEGWYIAMMTRERLMDVDDGLDGGEVGNLEPS